MQADPARPSSQSIATTRRASPLALTIFALAYIGALVIVFAPKGSFISSPYDVHVERDEAQTCHDA